MTPSKRACNQRRRAFKLAGLLAEPRTAAPDPRSRPPSGLLFGSFPLRRRPPNPVRRAQAGCSRAFRPRAASGNWRGPPRNCFATGGKARQRVSALTGPDRPCRNRQVVLQNPCVERSSPRRRHRGAQRCAGRRHTRRALVQLAGDRHIAGSLIKLLGSRGAYAGGQGHAGTSQIGHPLLIKGTLVQKPSFWLFNANALATLANAKDRREQLSVDRP
jgi:hypothetical protein